MAIPLLAGGIAFSGLTTKAEAQVSDVRLKVARFWRGEGRTWLEGLVGLPVAQTTRSVDLEVKDSTGKSLYTETWTDSAGAQAAALKAMNAETTTPLQIVLSPGLYRVQVRKTEGTDVDTANIQVRGFDAAPVISDVVVGAHMRVLAEGEQPSSAEMQRGRYAIERSTRVTVLPSESKLWYYLELYRQGADSIAQLEFRVVPEGKDTNSALVRVQRTVAVGARGTVDAAALVVQGLPPGNYALVVNANSGNRKEQRVAQFTMNSFAAEPVAGAVAPTAPGGGASEEALYSRYFAPGVASDADIVDMVTAMTVGTPGDQVGRENLQLTTDAKRRFLARYWSRLPDPDPATPQHEMLDEYANRVRYVERQFKEKNGRPGVQTDRGRIYLRYGPPDASQLLQMPSFNKSVMLWKYTRKKSLKYAFLDETGFENYNLVYTTDPLEKTMNDWETRVYDPDIIRQIVSF